MSDIKAKIYTPQGQYIGYLLNPTVEQFPENEYEITGFFEDTGETSHKLEFNPESVPYTIDLSDMQGLKHARLINVYVQRGRQPVIMTGVGAAK